MSKRSRETGEREDERNLVSYSIHQVDLLNLAESTIVLNKDEKQ